VEVDVRAPIKRGVSYIMRGVTYITYRVGCPNIYICTPFPLASVEEDAHAPTKRKVSYTYKTKSVIYCV